MKKEKTYTVEEAMALTAQYIEEQALVLQKNLRAKKRLSSQFGICTK